MRECRRRRVGETSWLLAFGLVILACALPVNADTLPASHAVAPDRLFDPPLFDPPLLVSALVSASQLPSFSTDLLSPAEESRGGFAFATVSSETDTLDLLADQHDNRSESGAEGVRRLILLAILFGGALRYLTSPAFYAWAVDVFGPLGGY